MARRRRRARGAKMGTGTLVVGLGMLGVLFWWLTKKPAAPAANPNAIDLSMVP